MSSSRRAEDKRQWEAAEHFHRERMAAAAAVQHLLSEEEEASSSRRTQTNKKYNQRERVQGHNRLMMDYFNPNSTYDARTFRRRYRMQPSLFRRIMVDVVNADNYFTQRVDACRQLGLSPEQKLTSSFRMLANGCSADSVDEYVRMGESTSFECLRHFCKAIIHVYGAWYLRQPNPSDLERLLNKASRRGFPGMIGSIDCMHWEWKNCPTAWAGQFTGHKKKPTIILEAVASYDTWIWHAFFGTAGSNNDLNVLGCSPVFNDVINGSLPIVQFKVNGNTHHQTYYLADGIYPSWATFVKTISNPDSQKKSLFAKKQEEYRKDVERAFGILQSRWAIIRGPARIWDVQTIGDIMLTCIILHNMIVEDEYTEDEDHNESYDYDIDHNSSYTYDRDRPTLQQYMERHNRIRNAPTHHALRNDLIEHLWEIHGNN